jgi:hypothetical protein
MNVSDTGKKLLKDAQGLLSGRNSPLVQEISESLTLDVLHLDHDVETEKALPSLEKLYHLRWAQALTTQGHVPNLCYLQLWLGMGYIAETHQITGVVRNLTNLHKWGLLSYLRLPLLSELAKAVSESDFRRFDCLNPAWEVPDNVFMIEHRHGLDLSVNKMALDILVNREMYSNLLQGIRVLVKFVTHFKHFAKATLAQRWDFLERLIVPSLL